MRLRAVSVRWVSVKAATISWPLLPHVYAGEVVNRFITAVKQKPLEQAEVQKHQPAIFDQYKASVKRKAELDCNRMDRPVNHVYGSAVRRHR